MSMDKGKIETTERIEISNKESIRTLRKKECYLGILDTIKQTDEKQVSTSQEQRNF